MSISSPSLANPLDGQVAAGTATITETGKKLDVVQGTDRVVIDWRSFDIAPDEHTQFYQPTSTSVALNRINSVDPSTIAGKLTANGNVILVNPNGVFFSKTATVDVNGLIATTAGIDNNKFMAGSGAFDKAGNPHASVINEGTITAKAAGLVGLVAPNVINSGTITAKLGRVQLASGDTVTLDLYGDGLMEVKASDALTSQVVNHSGSIDAAGGTIALSAAAGRASVNSVVKVTGELKAPSVGMKNGKIIIAAEGSNAVAGNVTANKGKKTGNSTVLLSGAMLDASGKGAGEQGGTVIVTADQIALTDGTHIDASGNAGGGSVHVGGDYLGQGDTGTARVNIMQTGTTIDTSALVQGNGGDVILFADERTEFGGTISARGAGTGNGGFTETSGKQNLQALGTVDLTAAGTGNAGTWLLDPADITVTAATNSSISGAPSFTATATASQVSAATIKSSLDAGTNVTILTTNDAFAGNGDIFVNSAISTTGTGALTLSAFRNIGVSSAITLQGGALTLRSDNTGIGSGAINITSAAISTNGGNILMGGGSGSITAGSGFAVGSTTTRRVGISLSGGSLNAGGGNVVLNGQGWGDATCNNNCWGINLTGSSTISTTGNGTISLNGVGGGSGATMYDHGMQINGSATTLTSQNGDISLTGRITETGGGAYAVSLVGGPKITTTGTGSIILTATDATLGGLEAASATAVLTSGNNISYIGNLMKSTTGANISFTAANDIILRPYTAGTTVGIGTGAGTLNISDAFLGALTAGGTLWIGGTGTPSFGGYINTAGDMTVNTALASFTSNLALLSTGTITTSSALTLNSGKNLTFTGDALTLGGNVTGTGNVVIQPHTTNRVINIMAGAGNLYLSSTTLGKFQSGWNTIIFGNSGLSSLIQYGSNFNPFSNITLLTGSGNIRLINGVNTLAANKNFAATTATGSILADYGAGSLTTSGTGNITLNAGVDINFSQAFTLAATGTGSILEQAKGSIISSAGGTLTTAGGAITLNADRDANNSGAIYLSGASNLASNGGAITLGGGANPLATAAYGSSATYASGIYIFGTTINGGTNGNVSLLGTGYGAGTDSGTTTRQHGIILDGSTVQTAGTGTITMSGTGAGTGAGSGFGVYVYNSSTISSANGAISINSAGGGGASSPTAYGFALSNFGINKVQATGTGNITISGGGSNGGGDNNHGIYLNTTNTSGIYNGSGNLSLRGYAGVGSNSVGINILSTTLGGASTSGLVELAANTLVVTGVPVLQTTGQVILRPTASNTSIGVAGASGTLQVTTALLNTITAGSIQIGHGTNNHLITANAYSWATNVTFLSSAANIVLNGLQTLAANKNFTATAGTGSNITIGAGGGATTSGTGTIALSAANLINMTGAGSFTSAAGTIGLTGTNGINLSYAMPITSTSGNITFTGPLSTGAAQVFNAGTGTITTTSTVNANANDLTFTADDVAIGGAMSGTGVLTLQPSSASRQVYIKIPQGASTSAPRKSITCKMAGAAFLSAARAARQA